MTEKEHKPEHLDMLRHMLGINDPSKLREPYRDYAAAIPGDTLFVEMENLGLVKRYRKADETTEYDWYTCTEAGKKIAIESHKSILLPKSKRRYLRYLDISDCHHDLSFKEFLTSPEYAEARRTV